MAVHSRALSGKNNRVLITDDVHPLLIERLRNRGFRVDYRPAISLAQVRNIIGPYAGIIINSKIRMDRPMLDSAPALRFIGRLGSGMEIIDTVYARRLGIKLFRAPQGNSNAVGEHALGMLLALADKLIPADRHVKSLKPWNREAYRGFELKGKTIGIIGLGHTGRSFARKLQGFGVKVLAYDKYKQRIPKALRFVTMTPDVETLLRRSDVVSFHLPLTSETIGYLDAGKLAYCKDGVILINTSRGKLIPTELLVAGLESGKIGGACLDVFENEKVGTYTRRERQLYRRLFDSTHVITSPHVAGWTVESKRKLAEVLLRQVLRLADKDEMEAG